MIALLLLVFFFNTGHTADTAWFKAKGKLTKSEKGFFVEFGPRYQAQLFVGTLPAISHKSNLKILDSTCGGTANEVQCTYETEYGLNKANWLWVKHPDSKHLGHEISYRSNPRAPVMQMEGSIAFKTIYAPQRHIAGATRDRLLCNHYRWIPSQAKQIDSWYTSDMTKNSETGESENRAVSALIQQDFKIENGSMILGNYAEVQAFEDFFINPFIHGQQTMIFTSIKKSCQVNWLSQVPASEDKRFFDEKMKSITVEKPVPLLKTDLFTSNQVRAAEEEFTKHEIWVR